MFDPEYNPKYPTDSRLWEYVDNLVKWKCSEQVEILSVDFQGHLTNVLVFTTV